MVILLFIIAAVISYLLGSVNFAVIISNIFEKKDVRDMGSGNAGMTNVLRNFGALPGVLTLVGDALKSVVSACIGVYGIIPVISDICNYDIDSAYMAYVCAFFCMLGHIFPVFFQFRGGKGIVVAIASIFVIDWRVAIVLLTVFALALIFAGIVSLGSVLGAIAFPVSAFVFNIIDEKDIKFIIISFVLGTAMALLTIFMHRENIKRLLKGEEKRLRVKKTEKR